MTPTDRVSRINSEARADDETVRWRRAKGVLAASVLVVCISAILFSEYILSSGGGWLQVVAHEVAATCHDPATQWMVSLCLAIYAAMFLVLDGRATKSGRNRNLTGLLFGAILTLVLSGYSINYGRATYSTEILVLLAGILCGKGALVWGRTECSGSDRKVQWLLGVLAYLLAACALCHADFGRGFEYHKIPRWRGPWDNPNAYGMLMGVATVLSFGFLISSLFGKKFQVSGFCFRVLLPSLAMIICGIGLFKSYSRGAWIATGVAIGYLIFKISSAFAKAVVRQGGEFNAENGSIFASLRRDKLWSMERGVRTQLSAECGTGSAECGAVDLSGNSERLTPVLSSTLQRRGGAACVILWLYRNWRVMAVIGVSLAVIGFWQFRFTEWRPARRVFSVANINDFSWRNRVTAWEGAIRMMVDKPWFGYGWGHAEEAFQKKYCPPNLDDGMAIQMNDYCMLGISAGVPALVCFLVYVGLSLKQPRIPLGRANVTLLGVSTLDPPLSSILRATCRAGAVLLLVGFWFDGGLFKLATGSVFWILLELGKTEIPSSKLQAPEKIQDSNSKEQNILTTKEQRNEQEFHTGGTPTPLWLKWVAGVVAALALIETIVLVGTPFLPVSKLSLGIARHWLISPKAVGDLNFLGRNLTYVETPGLLGESDGRDAPATELKLSVLLQHASLANYNRQLVNWSFDDKIYRDYVLTPIIDPQWDDELAWRRALWEYFYPPVRKENDPAAAAEIVMKFLRQRVTIVAQGPETIDEMWKERSADARGFEALKVAAFRSVGVPARLNDDGQAELFVTGKWLANPL